MSGEAWDDGFFKCPERACLSRRQHRGSHFPCLGRSGHRREARCDGCRRGERRQEAGCTGLVDARRRESHCRPRSVCRYRKMTMICRCCCMRFSQAPPPETALAAEGRQAGRQAGWKQITKRDTSSCDTAARQAASRPYHARRLAATRTSAILKHHHHHHHHHPPQPCRACVN